MGFQRVAREMVAAGAQKLPSSQLQPEVLSPTDGKPILTDGEKYFSQDNAGATDRPKMVIYVAMNGHTITPAEVAELVRRYSGGVSLLN